MICPRKFCIAFGGISFTSLPTFSLQFVNRYINAYGIATIFARGSEVYILLYLLCQLQYVLGPDSITVVRWKNKIASYNFACFIYIKANADILTLYKWNAFKIT